MTAAAANLIIGGGFGQYVVVVQVTAGRAKSPVAVNFPGMLEPGLQLAASEQTTGADKDRKSGHPADRTATRTR